ncbi:hypothetical protein Ddye_018040 [Dipteronia dyeriana]|uniref:DUF4283 domain-containing protein n=1 Tax=Dipteronia dyeriana TaxID=168575 RepID=A0AAD9X133_9ROSI|nr:hypothetical protein Ddye_018040 [Dipteronia dyeriana]
MLGMMMMHHRQTALALPAVQWADIRVYRHGSPGIESEAEVGVVLHFGRLQVVMRESRVVLVRWPAIDRVQGVSLAVSTMNAEEVGKLCASLSLTDREGPVHKLQDGLKIAEAQKLVLCLTGKFLSPNLINRDAFRTLIPKITNVYAFHFQLLEDRRRVLTGGPWSFDNALIVLKEPAGKGAIKSLNFNQAEFWV